MRERSSWVSKGESKKKWELTGILMEIGEGEDAEAEESLLSLGKTADASFCPPVVSKKKKKNEV